MKNALIVIDVQRHFLKNNLGFVQKVKTLCREYKKVYQIFDSIDSDKPDFIFPNQVQSIEKQYGFDLDDSNVEDYLSGSELEKYRNRHDDSFHTDDGRMIIQTSGVHPYFLLEDDLLKLCKSFSGKDVDLAGGAANECLEDINAALVACHARPKIILSYAFGDTSDGDESDELNLDESIKRVLRKP